MSGAQLHLAVLATRLSFLMATNCGEQARRALFRTGATAIGIVVGDVAVHVTAATFGRP